MLLFKAFNLIEHLKNVLQNFVTFTPLRPKQSIQHAEVLKTTGLETTIINHTIESVSFCNVGQLVVTCDFLQWITKLYVLKSIHETFILLVKLIVTMKSCLYKKTFVRNVL